MLSRPIGTKIAKSVTDGRLQSRNLYFEFSEKNRLMRHERITNLDLQANKQKDLVKKRSKMIRKLIE